MARTKKATMANVLEAVAAERRRQDKIWGGPDHDDRHTSHHWAAFRGKFENKQRRLDDEPALQRAELVKLAALCVAQIESIERKQSKADYEIVEEATG